MVQLNDFSARLLLDEAQAVAIQTCRRLRISTHDVDDVGQDLLLDLIARMPAYRSERGSLGAFANVVFRNRASRIAASIRGERAALGFCVSIDEPVDDDGGISLGHIIPESRGYPAMFGQEADRREQTEVRLSTLIGLAKLSDDDRGLCVSLSQFTVDELVDAGLGARSTLYRRLDRIRLDLAAFGVGAV